ncbi:MAG: complex I NDUFA9 subunit family protein [Hydrogenophilus sp.]|nr:complex I NDUFA9 subunit family protein [Hydrogenophilus sp.]
MTSSLRTIVLFGGSGFIGSHLANRLAAAGWRIVVVTRRAVTARHLLILPTLEIVESPLPDPERLAAIVAGADAVVNLIGILHSRPGTPFGPDFARAHVEWPQRIATACCTMAVPRLIHISANGASPSASSEYLRSKAAGEAAIRTHCAVDHTCPTHWTILRPSVVFGPGDSFFTLFARLAALLPLIPLGKANAQLQPIYVGDLCTVIEQLLSNPLTHGQTYALGGPRTYTLKELVAYAARISGHPRPILSLPDPLARWQAWLLSLLPTPPLTPDNLRTLEHPNTISGPPLPFGLTPTPLEAVVPLYLGNTAHRCRYARWRRYPT